MTIKNSRISVDLNKNNVSDAIIEQMWGLYQQYYYYEKRAFINRIKDYDYLALFKQKAELVGFIGIKVDRPNLDGQQYLLMRFGQAVIQQTHRGKSLIPITSLKLCCLLWKDLLKRKLYFWADNISYKSYLVFAKTAEEFYPTYKTAMPSAIKSLIDFIGENRYPDTYDKATGTVRKNSKVVSDASCTVCHKYLQDSDIQYYVTANQGYEQGHGLITVAPVNKKNLLNLTERFLVSLFSFGKKAKISKTRKPKTVNGDRELQPTY